MESFVPVRDIQTTHERACWDADADEWHMMQANIDKENRPVRPMSSLGLPRPTAEFARINRAMGDYNPRFMYDSIVITDLDLPERTTEDYEVHPELGDHIERALVCALAPDENGQDPPAYNAHEERDAPQKRSERPGTGQRKRPSSGRPGTGRKNDQANPLQAAFPQSRGLVS